VRRRRSPRSGTWVARRPPGVRAQELVAARRQDSCWARAARRVSDTTVAVVDGEVAGFVMVVGDAVEQVCVAAGHSRHGRGRHAHAESRTAHRPRRPRHGVACRRGGNHQGSRVLRARWLGWRGRVRRRRSGAGRSDLGACSARCEAPVIVRARSVGRSPDGTAPPGRSGAGRPWGAETRSCSSSINAGGRVGLQRMGCQKSVSYHAAWSYSWIRPPRTSPQRGLSCDQPLRLAIAR
jgi:hypothetical protein